MLNDELWVMGEGNVYTETSHPDERSEEGTRYPNKKV